MLKKLSFTILLHCIFNPLFAYTDLGIYGNTHLIKEKSFDILLQEKYKENVIKDNLLNEITKAYEKSFSITSSLGTCNESLQREYIPNLTLSEDIILPYSNEVLFKKGYIYNILKENNIFFNKYLIFIDASDEVQVKLAKKYYKYADIFIVNGNTKELLLDGYNVYKAREKIEIKMLDIKCVPTVLTQQENIFLVNEYNPHDLIKKEESE
jgi:hypothetical protein